ncbi:ferredoxin [Mycolicibacterium phlei]|jgi:ferredoxin|uniref:Ferredoxin n=1 Tax=Mycolicibacterium phlei DSM 43239 = CCUG 21000 TaxID=1226750 RepID=A0A5N5UQS1_MYCPH|nr:ferredoxin [Mycolicibacterium phlei]VEG11045.1 ferredoxin [Mycobacteroides chelonae]AMO62945.1 hypothetical protein MPHLCCUG_04157 [Mycolicibacterium phlei]EID09696.1 hypothetical protein MPHLEI_24139 [Mycolicibacterium phlei RIVM601174]KAB7751946.1 ferredoxin [Mycolicibacterium phlei DSM 43239 = CCUG 21000]KXW60543.1 ferredoxin [Mycolicibacterium phlei DSM 43239 = CCUG 21000]
MRIRLDKSACAGHALCHGVDARLFPLDDDGYSALRDHEVSPSDEAAARLGVQSCPEQALHLDAD